MKKIKNTPLALTVGTTLFSGLAVADVDTTAGNNLTANPFAMTELTGGYMQTAEADKQEGKEKMKDGSCGEGKCGDKMKKDAKKMDEGKCGEGKCGDKMKKGAEKSGEGKCGEGKCAGKK